MKKFLTVITLFCSLVFSRAIVTVPPTLSYEANLAGLQEVPPNASPAFGLGDFSLRFDGTFSVTSGSYQDLLGNSTAITLNDAAPGSNGSIIFSLVLDSPGTTTGTFSGSGSLTPGQVTDLNAGNLYVNIQSQVFPGGEIRGQIEPVPEPSIFALLGAGSLALLARRHKV